VNDRLDTLVAAFNAIMETYALSLWWDGVETNNDGELVQVHTGYAMGADDA